MKKFSAKKWICGFVSIVLCLTVSFSALTIAVDPFFQFRVKDNEYLLNGRFVSEGLIKNYDYDTLMLGSSMVQNFDMQMFREEIGGKPLHYGSNGITTAELEKLLKLSYSADKAKKYYIAAEMYQFAGGGEDHIPDYLVNDGVLSRLRYCLSFESWFRYMPVDIALSAAKKAGIKLPEKFKSNMSIDLLDNWSNDFSYGEDIVLNGIKTGEFSVSKVETQNLHKRLVKNIDSFFEFLDYEGKEYIFFFPPYSAAYWAITKCEGYFDEFLFARQYFTQKAAEKGCVVYDFQEEEFTNNINNYKDTTHYKHEINDYMLKCMAQGKKLVTPETLEQNQQKIRKNAKSFALKHKELNL